MKNYLTKKPISLLSGKIRLSDDQANARSDQLSKIVDDVYWISSKIEFKAGEIFGYDGDLPKTLAASVDEIISGDSDDQPEPDVNNDQPEPDVTDNQNKSKTKSASKQMDVK